MRRRLKPLDLPGVRVKLARLVPVLRSALVLLEDLADDMNSDVGPSVHSSAPVQEQKIVRVIPRHPTAINHVESEYAPTPAPRESVVHTAQPKRKSNGAGLPGGEMAILIAVAQHGAAGVTSEQLTVLTGFKQSYRDLILRHLRVREYIETDDAKQHTVTVDGKRYLGPSFKPLPTGAVLREHWLAKLPGGESRIFALALARYPNPVSRDELSQETDFKQSYRDLCIRHLVSRRLLEKTQRSSVRAAKKLFE